MIRNPAQLTGDVADVLPSPLAILLETAPQHVIELRMRVERGDRRRLAAHDRGNHGERACALERLPSRKHLVEHAAKREDVDAVIARTAVDLLGRHVRDRAAEAARCRRRRRSRCDDRRSERRLERRVQRLRTRSRSVRRQSEVEQLDVGRSR